jgi:hypothetical protein
MHAQSKQAFEAAQAAVLDRFGVQAKRRYVEVGMSGGAPTYS